MKQTSLKVGSLWSVIVPIVGRFDRFLPQGLKSAALFDIEVGETVLIIAHVDNDTNTYKVLLGKNGKIGWVHANWFKTNAATFMTRLI